MKYYTITLHSPMGVEAYTNAYDIVKIGLVISFMNKSGKRISSNLPYIIVEEA